MDKHHLPESLLHTLEHCEVGIIQLDAEFRLVAMNEFARRTLPIDDKRPLDRMLAAFPEQAQSKLRSLLDKTRGPDSDSPPVAMIIDIPERVLLSRLCGLVDMQGTVSGYSFVFYDITEAVSAEGARHAQGEKRILHKIPTVKQHRIVLVDTRSVSYIRSDGHYTWVWTAQGSHFCNLAISDLEERLDPDNFLRIHRSYIANLAHASQILKDDGRIMLKLLDDMGTAIPVARTSVPKLMDHLGLSEPSQNI